MSRLNQIGKASGAHQCHSHGACRAATGKPLVPVAALSAIASGSTDADPASSASYLQYTSGLGQVVSTSASYARVEVLELLPEGTPTPQQWQLPQGVEWAAGDGTAGCSGSSSDASRGSSSSAASSRQHQAPTAPPRHRPLLCNVRALLRKLRQSVLVGDRVRVDLVDWRAGRGVVSEVLARSSELTDPAVANVEHVMLLFALDQPPFEEFQVSRFLVAAEASGLPFSLLLNKADLVSQQELQARMQQCRSWGYEPIVLSCETGEGVQQVAAELQGRINVVAGPSGAGKSSLINSLRMGRHRPDLRPSLEELGNASDWLAFPGASADLDLDHDDDDNVVISSSGNGLLSEEEADGGTGHSGSSSQGEELQGRCREDGAAGSGSSRGSMLEAAGTSSDRGDEDAPGFLAVGELSKIGRGRHTTTTTSLIKLLGGGMLADTPGFGQPTVDNISSQELAYCFPEIAAVVSERPCRYSNCLHVSEPGCSVSGQSLERYPHYLKLLAEIKTREDFDVKALQQGRRAREGVAKAKAAKGGKVRLEAKLDPTKHRRTSRQATRQRISDSLREVGE